jgi:OmcA/MtrC family decaheme c-type cytochrome
MLEGHPAADLDNDGDFDEDHPVTSGTMAFAINDADATPRRTVVSIAKCQDCHNVNDGLAFHGGNRSDNITACATCHTADSTDLYRRPVDPDGMVNGVNENAVDGLENQSVSMGYMIHAIHAASVREEEYVAYGFRNTPHPYGDASYSRSPAECQACHEGDSYTLPLADGRLATTTEAGATVLATSAFGPRTFEPGDGSAGDPTDDNNVSAETAACVACHNSDVAIDHMSVRSDSGFAFGNGWLQNPNPFTDPDTQAFIDQAAPENCAFCHSEGSFVPVSEVHLVD